MKQRRTVCLRLPTNIVFCIVRCTLPASIVSSPSCMKLFALFVGSVTETPVKSSATPSWHVHHGTFGFNVNGPHASLIFGVELMNTEVLARLLVGLRICTQEVMGLLSEAVIVYNEQTLIPYNTPDALSF